MGTSFKKILKQFIHVGSTHYEGFLRRQIIFTNQIYILSIITILLYICFYIYYDFYLFLPVILFDTIIIFGIIFSLFLNANEQFRISKVFFLILTQIMMLFLIFNFGVKSYFHIYYFLLIAFIIITFSHNELKDRIVGLGLIILTLLLYFFCEFYLKDLKAEIELPENMIRQLYFMNLIGSNTIYLIMLYFIIDKVKKSID